MSINYGNNTNGVTGPCHATLTSHITVTCHVTVTCPVNRHRLAQVNSLPLGYLTQCISQSNGKYSEGSVSLIALISFLHGHYVACLAMGYSCSFDINLTCYFSSVMRNVTALERVFSVVYSAICFAGALGLMCQHGGQGVNIFLCDIALSGSMIEAAGSLIDVCSCNSMLFYSGLWLQMRCAYWPWTLEYVLPFHGH